MFEMFTTKIDTTSNTTASQEDVKIKGAGPNVFEMFATAEKKDTRMYRTGRGSIAQPGSTQCREGSDTGRHCTVAGI